MWSNLTELFGHRMMRRSTLHGGGEGGRRGRGDEGIRRGKRNKREREETKVNGNRTSREDVNSEFREQHRVDSMKINNSYIPSKQCPTHVHGYTTMHVHAGQTVN